MVFTYPPWIAAQFVALAFLFQAVFGISIEYGIVLGASIVVVYTYIGGMWAVSYTDMMQGILIFVGLIILLFNVLDQTGGITPLFIDKPESFFDVFPENSLEKGSEYIALLIAFIIGLTVASLSLILVCIFAPFTFGLFWERASIFGAWMAIIVGGLTWFFYFIFETRIDATIYGTLASCAAMIIGSLVYPDKVKFTKLNSMSK